MFSVTEIYDMAITLEKNGRRFYEEALSRVTDTEVKKLITFLRDQEVEHLEVFTKLKNQHLSKNPQRRAAPPGMEDFVQDIMSGRLFSWEDHPLISEDTPFQSILEAALEFEKDGLAFFQFMKEALDSPEDLAEMEQILEQEHDHVEKLKNLRL
jgi:rubrerythrin